MSFVLSSHLRSGSAWRTIGEIVLQLFVPFVCGQLIQPLIGRWAGRNESIVSAVDQGSILLIVYSAFSAAVGEGLWHQVPPSVLVGLLVADGVLFAAALITGHHYGQGDLRFAHRGRDRPSLMLFHQIQLMVCAALTQQWGRRAEPSPSLASAGAKSLLPD
jgi:sodium/bile acid cotransporter 7